MNRLGGRLLLRTLAEGHLIRCKALAGLAAFALRMVAVAQYTHPERRPVPRHHREHLVTHRSPPQHAEVWAFYYTGDDTMDVVLQGGGQRLSGSNERVPEWANAYRGILRIGHLVLELAARTDNRPYPAIPADDRAFVRLWPMEFNRIPVWPPDRLLDHAEFARRLSSFDAVATVWSRGV
jgi:hypothetical protein